MIISGKRDELPRFSTEHYMLRESASTIPNIEYNEIVEMNSNNGKNFIGLCIKLKLKNSIQFDNYSHYLA